MAEQMGLPGLIVPEQYGGAGLGSVELAVVMEEMGRVLLCAPYLSTAVLATNALLLAATEAARADLLPKIAGGQLLATLAWTEPQGGWEPAAITMPPNSRFVRFFISLFPPAPFRIKPATPGALRRYQSPKGAVLLAQRIHPRGNRRGKKAASAVGKKAGPTHAARRGREITVP